MAVVLKHISSLFSICGRSAEVWVHPETTTELRLLRSRCLECWGSRGKGSQRLRRFSNWQQHGEGICPSDTRCFGWVLWLFYWQGDKEVQLSESVEGRKLEIFLELGRWPPWAITIKIKTSIPIDLAMPFVRIPPMKILPSIPNLECSKIFASALKIWIENWNDHQ